MNLPPLILASKSPRRKQILEQVGFDIEIRTKETEESYPGTMDIYQVPEFLSRKKAEVFLTEKLNKILLTADTVVILGNQIMGKPENKDDAFEMLNALSGRKHLVLSGVTLLYNREFVSFSDETEVYFKKLNNKEIYHYIDTYKPFDKAGAYGIQEWIGMIGIKKIVGSFYNVMGLPIEKVYDTVINI